MFHARLGTTCPLQIPLVNGPVPIVGSYFTASSEYGGLGAYQARINNTASWCAASNERSADPNMYIQVSAEIIGLYIFPSLLGY